jgi:hypothetical protein
METTQFFPLRGLAFSSHSDSQKNRLQIKTQNQHLNMTLPYRESSENPTLPTCFSIR